MISKLSEMIAKLLLSNINREDITRFANKGYDIIELESRLKVLLIYIFMIPLIVIESELTGLWKENLISIVLVLILRVLNKGHHFSPDLCLVITTSVITLIPLISEILDSNLLKSIIIIISIFIYILFPERINLKNYLKKFTLVFLCLFGYYLSDLLLAALFVLSFDQVNLKEGRMSHVK